MVNSKIRKLMIKIKKEKLLLRYALLLTALFVNSICYNLLLYPARIVAGGTNGLSIIIEEIFHITPSIFILLFSVACLIIGLFTLSLERVSGSFVATFAYPLFVDLTSGITSILDVNNSDIILICLFAGVISGWTAGSIYKTGFSSGGIALINQVIYEKFKISISKINFFINMVIVLLGAIYYGVENIIYAVIVLYLASIILDRVLLGVSKHKVFYIITSKEEEIKNYLLNEVKHGVTDFEVISGYSNKNTKVLMTVVPTIDYIKVKEGVTKIDKDSFFVITDSYQMLNGS